jgi:hypothetical protein
MNYRSLSAANPEYEEWLLIATMWVMHANPYLYLLQFANFNS